MTGGEPPAATDVADDVALETLLRCWLREAGIDLPPGARTARFELPASGLSVRAAISHRSVCGWHRFGPVELVSPGGEPSTLDAGLLAALLVREVTAARGLPAAAGTEALGRMIDSARRIAGHLEARRAAGTRTGQRPPPFLAAEQASVSGHPFHPAAQSRQGASDRAMAVYSPERAGSFALHWFAAHPDAVATSGTAPRLGTAVRRSGDTAATARRPAVGSMPEWEGGHRQAGLAELLADLSGGVDVPPGYLILPAHPWQAAELTGRGEGAAAELLADGRLVDLGVSGPRWYPTTSLRTVWRPDSPVMLKLSLGLRITNSRRVLQLGELRLAEMVSRLFDAGLGDPLAARHPAFHLIGEPAWVAVTHPDRPAARAAIGLETAVRVNPFGATDRAVCLSALVAARPDLAADSRGRARAAMLPVLLLRRAERGNEPVEDLAVSWFERYLAVLVAPVLDLYLRCGVGVEAHLQNTLLTVDADGWPVAGWYRDSQGYYVTASAAASAQHLIPGCADGLDLVFDDDLVAERVAYYLIINNVLAVVGALGAAGVADEHRLLGRVRALLTRLADPARPDQEPDRVPAGRLRLAHTLLTAATLPCKANLRTCVDGRDELTGPVATQSVYVRITNPLLEAAP
ncbi:Siderophore synthetase component [Frankia canadensis]|uniref:Siderophore synthetase component n=1 Tax=Frankia canadensis TaxID=1836972 RepID=A0A2I2KX80_9ACTN|nr:IucA/IucC family protein [Frankia canadensis]SNQ50273.1 Siderophore synthetase component [Frankia canadensis]SOU57563.1 Siderophore synthetase component [Frankia canadensis]